MATPTQRAARRRRRQRKAERLRQASATPTRAMASRASNQRMNAAVPVAGRASRRKGRGLLSSLGGVLGQPGAALGGLLENGIMGIANSILGTRALAAPTAFAGRTASQQVNKTVQHGVEQITTLVVPAGTAAGTILLQGLIAAPEIGIRLKQNAQLWARTMFLRFALVVTSSNPSTAPGNYTVACDPDPVVSYESGPELPARLMALVHASKANAWADNAVMAGLSGAVLFNRFDPTTATDAEVRQYADGQFIVATTTEYETECEYTVNVIWSVEFEQPNTEFEPEPPITSYILNMKDAEVTRVDPDGSFYLDNDKCWQPGVTIPALNYAVPRGQLTIQTDTSSFSFTITRIVKGDTDTATNFFKSGGVISVGDKVTVQVPPNYVVIPQQPRRGTFFKAGYALLSYPIFRAHHAGHQSWFSASRSKYERKLLAREAQKERVRRLALQFREMSFDDLEPIADVLDGPSE